MTWAMIFLLVILKIPIAYLCAVVWWAIKAEPRPEAPAALVPSFDSDLTGPSWRRSRRPRRGPSRGPSGGPARRPAARRSSARVYARR